MGQSNRTIIGSAIVPFRFVFLIWVVFVADFAYGYSFQQFGIIPRTAIGLIGIFTAPLLHGNVAHIASNTVPLLFLGAVLFFFYYNIARGVFLRCYFLTNILVWIFARPSIHIGASGQVYGLAFFLIFFGIFRRDLVSILISVFVMGMYGYLAYGIFPTHDGISWEAHLSGALVGAFTAYEMRGKKNVND
ncbi:MAG: rhomboid family intramembrane serine protease [Cyclobacteriaceae bacterium]|nr:rhomboid family intramembrane serine protease [Cyclobacteriaceae bacterium]